MTKMQTIAKAIIIFLGVYAFSFTMVHIPSLQSISKSSHLSILITGVVLLVFLALIIYFAIINNDGLSCLLSGQKNSADNPMPADEILKILRLTVVAVGLLSLPSILKLFSSLLRVLALILASIKNIQHATNAPLSPQMSMSDWFKAALILIQIVLAIYLIFGAPQYIKWQVKRAVSYNTVKKV